MISSNDSIRESLPCFCSLYHQLLQLGFHLRKEVNVKVFAKKRSGRKPTPKEDEFQGVVWCIMADLYIIKTCFIEISMGDWEMLPASISSSSRTSSHSVSWFSSLSSLAQPVTTRTEEKLPKTLFLRNLFFWITWWFHFSCSRKNCLFLFSALFSWDDMSFFQISTRLGHPDFLLITWLLKPRHFPRQVLTIIIFAESRPSLARLRMASCARKRLI